MTALRIAALAAFMAAFSLPALAQMCAPTEALMASLMSRGWQTHDAMTAPNGAALVVICLGETGGVLVHGLNGRTCFLTPPVPGMCRPPGEES